MTSPPTGLWKVKISPPYYSRDVVVTIMNTFVIVSVWCILYGGAQVFVYAGALPYAGYQHYSITVTYRGTTQALSDGNETDPMGDDDTVPLPTPNTFDQGQHDHTQVTHDASSDSVVSARMDDVVPAVPGASTDVDGAGEGGQKNESPSSWHVSKLMINVVEAWRHVMRAVGGPQ